MNYYCCKCVASCVVHMQFLHAIVAALICFWVFLNVGGGGACNFSLILSCHVYALVKLLYFSDSTGRTCASAISEKATNSRRINYAADFIR